MIYTHTHWHTQGNTILSSKTHKISMMGGRVLSRKAVLFKRNIEEEALLQN